MSINQAYINFLIFIFDFDPQIFNGMQIYDCIFGSNENLFLDLSKAFDHNISLRKICNRFGIRGKPHDLISSYLTDRYQYVKALNYPPGLI